MGFQDFLGNTATVTHLRESIRAERFPQSLILAGPRGAGKYTLALMLAKAVNCLQPTESDGLPDFCGVCRNCTRIADSANLEDAGRRGRRRPRRPARDRQARDPHPHPDPPDVLIIPPDPPQLLIKLGQVRQAIHVAYYRPPVESKAHLHHLHLLGLHERGGQQPAQGPRRAARAHLAHPAHREPAGAAAHHPLPRRPSPPGRHSRRRSRSPARRTPPRTQAADRALAARLAEGAVGRALTIDLGVYLASRQDALILLRTALREPDYSALFHATESYRAGADGQEKTSTCSAPSAASSRICCSSWPARPELIRNWISTSSRAAELDPPGPGSSPSTGSMAARALVQVEQGMRRNLLRSLSLDAMAVQPRGSGHKITVQPAPSSARNPAYRFRAISFGADHRPQGKTAEAPSGAATSPGSITPTCSSGRSSTTPAIRARQFR
jgi:DNA polymerase-3 subunit delta'